VLYIARKRYFNLVVNLLKLIKRMSLSGLFF